MVKCDPAANSLFWQSAWSHGADGGVGELRHGCPGGSDIIVSLSKASRAAWPAAAGEGGQQRLAETLVHEAVDDGIDTGRSVGQQVDEGDGGSREKSMC